MENKINLDEIFDCIEDGLFIIDNKGIIIGLNEMSVSLTTLQKDEMLGKSMYELVKMGVFPEDETCSLEAIRTKKKIVKIQRGIKGKYDILATATPFIRDGEVEKVITTERDITEILRLEAKAKKDNERANKYKSELDYYRQKDIVTLKDIVAKSRAMKNIISTATQVGQNDVTVLLQGETGVGKEIVSNIIQQSSKRKNKPFIKINCAAIPENLMESELFGYEKGAFTGALDRTRAGIFELADKGTLMLDEVDTIPLHLQPKLLRTLQEGTIFRIGGKHEIKVNVRIIAATNSNLKKAVDAGKFRKDLFYRLNVVPIKIPPLRERKEDVIPLAESFVNNFNKKYDMEKYLDPSAAKILLNHNWSGNARELENVIERAIVSSKENNIDSQKILSFLFEDDEALNSGEKQSLQKLVQEYEKRLIMEQMPIYRNAKALAAALKLDKSTLNRKIKKYNIQSTYAEK